MLRSAAIVLSLLVAGDGVADVLALPIPGASIGLVVLAAWFRLTGEVEPSFGRMFDAITPYVPMLFVPAAVGVLVQHDVVAAFWLELLAAIVGGTVVTIVVTGVVAQAVLSLASRRLPA